MKKKELEEYFTSDKTSWFTLDDEENKVWDRSRVSEFWERIRKYKVKKKDFNFSYYVFPDFEFEREGEYLKKNPVKKGNKKTESNEIDDEFDFFTKTGYDEKGFSEKVSFKGTVFLGNTSFYKYYFKEEVDFSHADFRGSIGFGDCVFFKDATFNNIITYEQFTLFDSIFHKKANFSFAEFCEFTFFNNNEFSRVNFFGVNFKEDVYVSDSVFKKKVSFMDGISEKNFRLNKLAFEEEIDFTNFTSLEETSFYNVLFGNDTSFDYAKVENKLKIQSSFFFKKCSFSHAKLNQLELIDLNHKIECDDFYYELHHEKAYISNLWKQLNNVSSSPKLFFDNVSFSAKTQFTRLNLKDIELYNCDVTLVSFSRCEWDVDNKRLVLKNENSNYRDSEIHYRQLKKVFDSEKNWEYSGYSYVSEMEMRKKRLWKEKKYADWLIYKFYSFFGGYTQNYLRPLFSLFILIVFSSVIYYFIDYNTLKAIQRGLKGAIPYLEIDTEKPFQGYWLIWKNIQLMLSGTFTAFFILALRKRFKQ